MCKRWQGKYLFAGFPLLQFGLAFYYVNFYSKESGLVWSLFDSMFKMCWIPRKQSENSCVWTFAVGFKRDIFQEFRRRVAVDMQRIAVCLQKKMFSRVNYVEQVTSNLKTLHDRIKRGLSEDVSVAPSFEQFEAARIVISPMKSINKTLFPSNATENPTRFLKTIKAWLFPYCTTKLLGGWSIFTTLT